MACLNLYLGNVLRDNEVIQKHTHNKINSIFAIRVLGVVSDFKSMAPTKLTQYFDKIQISLILKHLQIEYQPLI